MAKSIEPYVKEWFVKTMTDREVPRPNIICIGRGFRPNNYYA